MKEICRNCKNTIPTYKGQICRCPNSKRNGKKVKGIDTCSEFRSKRD